MDAWEDYNRRMNRRGRKSGNWKRQRPRKRTQSKLKAHHEQQERKVLRMCMLAMILALATIVFMWSCAGPSTSPGLMR